MFGECLVELGAAAGLPGGVGGEQDEEPGPVGAGGEEGGPDGGDLELRVYVRSESEGWGIEGLLANLYDNVQFGVLV